MKSMQQNIEKQKEWKWVVKNAERKKAAAAKRKNKKSTISTNTIIPYIK
jgi:hypothetical protein